MSSFSLLNTVLYLFFVALVGARPAPAAPISTKLPSPPSGGGALVPIAGHLYICTDKNFASVCTKFGFFDDICQNFPPGFADQISSAVADPGWDCALHESLNCADAGGTFVGNPGLADLARAAVDNAASSVQCIRVCKLNHTC